MRGFFLKFRGRRLSWSSSEGLLRTRLEETRVRRQVEGRTEGRKNGWKIEIWIPRERGVRGSLVRMRCCFGAHCCSCDSLLFLWLLFATGGGFGGNGREG